MTIANLTFSLVVNTTDRARSLQTLLRSLEHQSYPHFEVIVVVGPTHDNTLEMLREYQDRIQVLRCPQANLGRSRNIGLAAARGDIVAYVDDDAVPSQRWLEQLARLFADPMVDATGGLVYLIHPDNALIQHRIGIFSSLGEQVDVRSSWLEHLVPPGEGRQWLARMMGTNMAFRRRPLLEIGGFDEFFEWVYDDSDVALRLAQIGKIVHPVQEAVVYHAPASSRNRVVYTGLGKWWIQTKAAIYFTLKHGSSAGDSAQTMARRCLHLYHGHWLWSGQLRRAQKITFRQSWYMRYQETRSALIGATHGLFQPRQLLNSAEFSLNHKQSIQPFQNEQSARQPTVDPMNGRRSHITLTDPPLRICLLSSAYPPAQYEGVGRLTHLMAQGLFECGHAVHVITRGERDEVAFYDGAYVHKVKPGLERYGRYHHLPRLHHLLNYSHSIHDKIQRLILNDGIQLVDSPLWQVDGLVTAMSHTLPVVVRLVTALRQISNIQQERDKDAWMVGEMEKTILEQATHLLPNTRATLEGAMKAYHVAPSPDRYTIVPYGIVPAPDEAVRPFDLKKISDTFTVLYLGRLERRKGIQELFQAIPKVLEKIPKARFIIAGADNSHNDGFQGKTGMTYPAYFASRYARYAPYVKFMGGVSEETLQELYQTCDLFVAPSLYESFGLIYLEAMNYAKPVIGCRAGGIPEVIDEGVNGLLAEPESAESLAEAIISMLQSPLRLYEMGLAGRERLMKQFTYLKMAQNFAAVYRRVIQERELVE